MKASTNRELHGLLQKTGLMEQKASLIYSFSEGGTESSKDMKEYMAIELIKHLRKLKQQQDSIEAEQSKMKQATRKYIISLWYRIENANSEAEKKQALDKCFQWVEKHFKSPLNSFEMMQLHQIKIAAEKVLKDRAKAVRRAVRNEKV